jgi:abortive infection bacteriophage resistance protein
LFETLHSSAVAKFKHVTDLYAFDKALRLLVLDAIERIEISVRTEVALSVGRHNPRAHRNPGMLDKNFTTVKLPYADSMHAGWLKKLDERAATSKEEFAAHFRKKYPGEHMPVWIAVELLDFGPLSHFLSGMRYADLQLVSASYGGLRPHLVKSWARSLSVVRNVCAHHSRVWNKPLVDQPALPMVGEIPDLDHLLQMPGANRRLYAALAIMRVLLKRVNPRTKWAQRLKAHIATFPAAPNIKMADAGFPADWDALPLWN